MASTVVHLMTAHREVNSQTIADRISWETQAPPTI
jgi:hypothetical protein